MKNSPGEPRPGGDRRSRPEASRSIHLIAVGGTGMAPLACLLQGQGHRVGGSDGPLYPPMSTLLEGAGIEPVVGFSPEHLAPPPDLVVVGNAVPRDNPEALEAECLRREGRVEILSMPETLWRFFLSERYRVVVAGTHGKTTTTSMASWVWTACGADPSYLIGGLPKDLPGSFHDGAGSDFVIEGDEYNAAYFDRGPKFLHYRPQTLILTSAEHDHVDLYPSHEALLDAYGALVELIPEDGLLVACGDDPAVRRLSRRARCRTILYGFSPEGGARGDLVVIEPLEAGPDGSRFRVADPFAAEAGAEREIRLVVPGRHNASNAAAVWIAARHRGLDGDAVADALGRFNGVARRLDELGTVDGMTVIDDFAHHPTAVGESLAALRRRFPGRRLVALFEPRSLTAGRRFLEDGYRAAFSRADRVLFAPVYHAARLEVEERLDFARLADALAADGVEAESCDSVEALRERTLTNAQPGDVLVTMSSGSFGGLPHALLEGLRSRV